MLKTFGYKWVLIPFVGNMYERNVYLVVPKCHRSTFPGLIYRHVFQKNVWIYLKSASLSKVFNHLFNLIWLILLHYFREFNNKTFSTKKNWFLLIPPEHYYAALCSPEGILVGFQCWSNSGEYLYQYGFQYNVWLHLHFEQVVHTMSSEQSTRSKWFTHSQYYSFKENCLQTVSGHHCRSTLHVWTIETYLFIW